MNLPSIHFPLVLLTPAMIGGAQGRGGGAEMRPASIRGHIRWWHRAAGFTPTCNETWGQTDGAVIASRVSLSLEPGPEPARERATILPHKDETGVRDSLALGKTFTLILRRLVGCSDFHWVAAQRATKLWLLLGGLGLRANRAAGSVWPLDTPGEDPWVPQDETDLRSTLTSLGYRHPVQLADASILSHPSLQIERYDGLKLRLAASDTVAVPQYFGSVNPRRIPSPLKIKVIRLGTAHRLLLTSATLSATDFTSARRALGRKPLGSVSWTSIIP